MAAKTESEHCVSPAAVFLCVCVCVGFVCLIKINQSNWVGMDQQFVNASWLHCALAVAQYVVIGPVFVCVWVCYHDNSKLSASIFTKLGL